MVIVAQLVRASACGAEGRGFESRHSPHNQYGVCVPSGRRGWVVTPEEAKAEHAGSNPVRYPDVKVRP